MTFEEPDECARAERWKSAVSASHAIVGSVLSLLYVSLVLATGVSTLPSNSHTLFLILPFFLHTHFTSYRLMLSHPHYYTRKAKQEEKTKTKLIPLSPTSHFSATAALCLSLSPSSSKQDLHPRSPSSSGIPQFLPSQQARNIGCER